MKKALFAFCVLIVGSVYLSKAQDIRFSQFYANKLYLNPAFAGSTNYSNVSLNYRNQWPNLDIPYVTYSVSFDNFYESLNGGIGIMVIQDDQGDGALTTTSFSGMYSFYLRINDELIVRPALQAAFMQKKIDWESLVFPDQVSAIYGNIYPHNTNEDPTNREKSGFDFSMGAVAYYRDFYFGIVAHHLAKPDLSFDDEQEDKLETKYTIHAGAEFVMGGTSRRYANNWIIAPALLFQKQGEFTQMNYGLYASKSSMVFGLWFNQNFELDYDSFILMAGFVTSRFKVAYSYDYTITKLIEDNTGAHEISFSFPLQFDTNGRKRKIKAVRSPVF
jgi:type IX secretion system PorP/SprF family membrane protein